MVQKKRERGNEIPRVGSCKSFPELLLTGGRSRKKSRRSRNLRTKKTNETMWLCIGLQEPDREEKVHMDTHMRPRTTYVSRIWRGLKWSDEKGPRNFQTRGSRYSITGRTGRSWVEGAGDIR